MWQVGIESVTDLATYTHILTHIHTHTHTYIRAHTHTHMHMHTHIHTNTHKYTNTCTHAHTQTMQTDVASPLSLAAKNGHTEVVVKLLSAGAKLNHQDKVRSVWY